jgi:WD40 repeat protein
MSLSELRSLARERYLKEQERIRQLTELENSIDIQPISIRGNKDDDGVQGENIPVELMIYIFMHLTPRDICGSISLVCKGWYFVSMRCDQIWRFMYSIAFDPVNSWNKEELEEDMPLLTSEQERQHVFSGFWVKKFSARLALRRRWIKNKPYSQGFLDMLPREMKNEKERDHTFLKNQYLVGQESVDTNEKKYSLIAKRSLVQHLALAGDKLISTDDHSRIKVWSLRTYQMLSLIETNLGINDVAASNDTIFVACNQSLFAYELRTGLLLGDIRNGIQRTNFQEVRGINRIGSVLNVDLRKLHIDMNAGLLFATTPLSVEIYDLASRSYKYSLLLKRMNRQARRFSSNLNDSDSDMDNLPNITTENWNNMSGILLHSKENILAVLSNESTIKLYDIRYGVCIKTLDLLEILRKKMLATTNIPEVSIKYFKIMNNQIIAVIVELRQPNRGGANHYLRYLNFSAGILSNKYPGFKIKIPRSRGRDYFRNHTYSFYMDSDKIVATGQQSILFDVNNGQPLCTIPLTITAHYCHIVTSLVNEGFLINGLSFGGIIALNFGGPQFYWAGLEHGHKLASTSNKEQIMDESP